MTGERAELLLLAMALPEKAVGTFSRAMVWVCPGLDKVATESPSVVEGIRTGAIPLCEPEDLQQAFGGNVVPFPGSAQREHG